MSRAGLLLANNARLATESVSGVDGDEHIQLVAPTAAGAVPTQLCAYLEDDSVADMNEDGSGTPRHYQLAPAASEIYRIDQVVLLMAFTDAPAMTDFGDLDPLTNGLKLEVRSDAGDVLADLFGAHPIKTLNDLAAVADLQFYEVGGSHTVRAVIALPVPIRLEGTPSKGAGAEVLRATVADDLSTLVQLRCSVRGQIESDFS